MKKIVIASGKGGVGKSMLASTLAVFFAQEDQKIVACDCDVDAPNLAIWLGETAGWQTTQKISTIEKPTIDPQKCLGCGLCVQNCQFGALKIADQRAQLDYFLCEGCGVCELVCPQQAIRLVPVENAEIRQLQTRYGFPLVGGQLFPGESASGKVVSEIKNQALALAKENGSQLTLIDAPPGTGCPVIAAVQDCQLAILVTEPTPSGVADLKRVLQTIDYFQIPYQVVINKWDLSPQFTQKIEKEFAQKILGKISYNQAIFQAIAQLQPIAETNLSAKDEIKQIYLKLREEI